MKILHLDIQIPGNFKNKNRKVFKSLLEREQKE